MKRPASLCCRRNNPSTKRLKRAWLASRATQGGKAELLDEGIRDSSEQKKELGDTLQLLHQADTRLRLEKVQVDFGEPDKEELATLTQRL